MTTFSRQLMGHPLFRPICVAVALILVAVLVDHTLLYALPFAVGASLTEGDYTGEFLLSEAPGTQSRDTVTVTVPAGVKLEPGTVLGQVAASGKYVPFDETASDGREEAAGILYAALDNEAGGAPTDFDDAVIVNWSAEVREDKLVWYDDADDATGLTGLRSLGIKARS